MFHLLKILLFCSASFLHASSVLLDYKTVETKEGLTLNFQFSAPIKPKAIYNQKANRYDYILTGTKTMKLNGRQELDHLLAVSFQIKRLPDGLQLMVFPRGYFGVETRLNEGGRVLSVFFKNGYPTREMIDPENKKFVVCIDPGHGGQDPGAQGRIMNEKETVLLVARSLEKEINSRPNMTSFLTRTRDYKIRLEDRPKISDRAKADVFISLHMNSSIPMVRGFEIFYLSEKGASQNLKAKLDEIESGKPTMQSLSTTASIQSTTSLLNQIILDMQQLENMNSSAVFAQNVALQMNKTGLKNRGVRRAAFVVLKTLDAPSILIEMGYITNKEDEKFYISAEGRTSFSKKVADGIDTFLKQAKDNYKTLVMNPPQMAEVVAQATKPKLTRRVEFHQVRYGETFGSIAQRYKVSYSDLLNANPGFNPDQLKAGQKLRLPGME